MSVINEKLMISDLFVGDGSKPDLFGFRPSKHIILVKVTGLIKYRPQYNTCSKQPIVICYTLFTFKYCNKINDILIDKQS